MTVSLDFINRFNDRLSYAKSLYFTISPTGALKKAYADVVDWGLIRVARLRLQKDPATKAVL